MKRLTTLALSTALLLASHAAVAQTNTITGAGATFPAPVYAKWADSFSKATGVRVNYQSVGSGAGVKQIESKTVDFGASDEPTKPEDLQAKGMVQFPTVMGGVVPVVNLPGVTANQIKLTGDVLAKIYLGEIKKWNDAAITGLNPGVNLPDRAIAPVRRADGSGTTFIFTNYLSKVSPEWKSKVGEGKAVNWPVGTGGKGNEGVAQFVQRLPGAIGYVEYAYAKQGKLVTTQLQNAAGKFVTADDDAFKAAAAKADWSNSFFAILTNQAGEKSWPISGATFILMHKQQADAGKATDVLKFFNWAYGKDGDSQAAQLDYVPMPDNVKALARKTWGEIKDGSGKAVAWQ
ncbi:phosphate ABC transporter substrate-binding protein PstS [Amphibiibacter pelophylacis]|uniref:Phosphate ABC transporter substrate-binding protein PstS n=1 Tax=Amphibiibacter pelophylacis TaxID=1799477 RepID=A0ACC6P0H6_9BURK